MFDITPFVLGYFWPEFVLNVNKMQPVIQALAVLRAAF